VIGAEEAGGTIDRLAGFVRRALDESHRSGIAVAMSGGLDSTVTAALCARAVGPERVRGFFLPEREGPPEDLSDASAAADWLGLQLDTHDVTGALREMGAYDFVLSRLPAEMLRAAVVKGVYALRRLVSAENPLTGGQEGSGSAIVSRASAHFKSRHRMRMVFLYFRAERSNLLVAGAANRTEKLTGVYTRFGVDDCADIMPIGALFRTEVLRIAESLGVPDRILRKPPTPGIIPGVSDKYVYLLGLESGVLDALLEDLVSGASVAEVSERHEVSQDRVRGVVEAMSAARRMAAPPTMPALALFSLLVALAAISLGCASTTPEWAEGINPCCGQDLMERGIEPPQDRCADIVVDQQTAFRLMKDLGGSAATHWEVRLIPGGPACIWRLWPGDLSDEPRGVQPDWTGSDENALPDTTAGQCRPTGKEAP